MGVMIWGRGRGFIWVD